VVVSAEDIDMGSNAVENISCEYNGEQMDIGFNTQYVNDILAHVDDTEVLFKPIPQQRLVLLNQGKSLKEKI
jgi:DNA polymerase-3 subunit beta